MNTQAIEAFKVAWHKAPEGSRVAAGLEAARPYLEAELRAQIAASIRDNPRVYDAPFTSNPSDWIDAFDRGIDYAARIAEGKQ